MKQSMQNIRDIISLGYILTKNAIEIMGKCENFSDSLSRSGDLLSKCKKCGTLICGFCVNREKTMCVICQTNNFKKCDDCDNEFLYSMCYYCSNIVEICTNGECNLAYDGEYQEKFIKENHGIFICGKCMK